jgi:outer membrane protein OmpA-like peptidoglycan-associated protein
VAITLFTLLLGQTIVHGQSNGELPFSSGHYVIIGAFAIKSNASRLKDSALKDGLPAAYAFNDVRNLYYVYLNIDNELSYSIAKRDSLRRSSKYGDAWIKHLPEVAVSSRGEVPPADEPTIEPTFTADLKAPVIQSEAEPSQESSLNLASREVFLSLYNESSDRVIEGKVQVVDTERSRLITLLNGNEYTTLPDPKNNSRQLTLICEASGYRKVQQEVNYDNPLTEESQNFLEEIGTTLVVNFPLVRYQKGDIYALYSVYFYNDAAIFLPESKFELNELLVMLQENPKTRIRLHGHSNGNSFGKIISVGPSGDRFSLAKDTKVSKGSSKELSAKRAELIKSFLIDNGIHPDRIETKAWGGKRPLHDKNSANAKKNVRVEVEILETK